MKRLLLLVLLSLFLVQANAQAEEPDPLSFFPHQVGDTWEYLYEHKGFCTRQLHKVDTDSNGSIIVNFTETGCIGSSDCIIDVNGIVGQPTPYRYNSYKLDAQLGETWQCNLERSAGGRNVNAIVTFVGPITIWDRTAVAKVIDFFELQPGETEITEFSRRFCTNILVSGIGLYEEINYVNRELSHTLYRCIIAGDTLGDSLEFVMPVIEIERSNRFTLEIFPNPSLIQTVISFPLISGVANTHIEVTNIFGKVVHSTDIQTDSYTLNTSIFPTGIYFCRVTAGTHTATQKIIVHR